MRDGWTNDLWADAPRPDERFKTALRKRLLDAWDADVPTPAVAKASRSRRWTIVSAAAVVALGVAGLVVIRTSGSSGPPAVGDPVPSAGVTTVQEVVGTWVVTESSGVPRPSPLPTYHFKIGTGPAGRGVVTGFDGCGPVAGTWRIENGQLTVTIDNGDEAKPCPYLGATTPLVPLTGAVGTQLGGELVLRFDDAGASVARHADALSVPMTLADTSWVLPVDGSDLRLAFATQDLTVTSDGVLCTRASYDYDNGTLSVIPASGTASGACESSWPTSLEYTAINVVEYTDDYSASLLLTTTTAGTVRVYPASGEQQTAAATSLPTSTSMPASNSPGSTEPTHVQAGPPVPLVLPASSGMTLDQIHQGALGLSDPIRWYATDPAAPEDGPYLRVVSATQPVPAGSRLGCMIEDPMAPDATRADTLPDGTPVCLAVREPTGSYGRIAVDRSPVSIIVEGNATDEQLLAAAANLVPSPTGGFEIGPGGRPAAMTEIGTGLGVSDFATVSLAASQQSMIQIGWSGASGGSLFYVATQDDPASISTMRLNYTTITDTTIRGEPGFLRTIENQPTYLGAVWQERATTYQVGSQGLTEEQLRQLLDELHVPTNTEWSDLLASTPPPPTVPAPPPPRHERQQIARPAGGHGRRYARTGAMATLTSGAGRPWIKAPDDSVDACGCRRHCR
jgi:hypothetical protein